MLQPRTSCTSEQSSDAWGVSSTVRLRDCVPPPHDIEHVVHSSHAEYGHAHVPSSQSRCSAATLLDAAAPPQLGCVIARVRVFCPPSPHVLLHELQLPHSPTAPSTGQQCSLQARVSAEWGHALPPNCGCTTARMRTWLPPPHVALHTPQLPSAKSLTAQSSGHDATLHSRVSMLAVQSAPSHSASLITLRLAALA